MTLDELRDEAAAWYQAQLAPGLAAVGECCGGCEAQVTAVRLLPGVGYGVVRPVFGKSDAVGSLMRRKLEPVILPLLEEIGLLQG